MLNRKTLKTTLLIGALAMCIPAQAKVKADIDTDGSGTVSLEEFVSFSAKRDLKQRDKNGDDSLSSEEWLGQSQGGFRQAALNRYDADGDGTLVIQEIVNIYVWTFGNRDANKDGQLSGDEIPKALLAK